MITAATSNLYKESNEGAHRKTALFIVIIVLLSAALRMPLLDIPFERDEGEYAYIGWRLGYNELPYRDWVDQKPPAIFWVYRAALALPFDPIRSVHLMGLLFSATSAVALFFLSRRFMGAAWAAAAACLFAALSADPLIQGTAANTELFMLLPLILSVIAFLNAAEGGKHAALWMLFSGTLTGLAVAFKQVAAVNWFFLVAAYPLFTEGRGRTKKRTLMFAGWSAFGASIPWLLIAGYFAARQGLGDLIYHVFTHNLEYISVLPWTERLDLCAKTLAVLSRSQAVMWLLSGVGFLVLCIANQQQRLLFFLGWVIASIFGVSASGYFFPHYFQQVLPVLAVTAAVGANGLYEWAFVSAVPPKARAAVLVLSLAALPAITLAPYLFSYTPAEAVRKIYPGNFFAEMPAFGARIAEQTGLDDRVFIFGAEPEVLFYARRVSATRYIFLFPLYGPYRDALEKQTAAAKEVLHARPAAAVYLPNNLFTLPGSEQYFTRWSRQYLEETFRSDAYLTVDHAGASHVITGAGNELPQLPPGHAIAGAVLLRKGPP